MGAEYQNTEYESKLKEISFYNLTSITIPDSVTDIGECAFEGCDSVTFNYIKTGDKDENQNKC